MLRVNHQSVPSSCVSLLSGTQTLASVSMDRHFDQIPSPEMRTQPDQLTVEESTKAM